MGGGVSANDLVDVIDKIIVGAVHPLPGVRALVRVKKIERWQYAAFVQEGSGIDISHKLSEVTASIEREYRVYCPVQVINENCYELTIVHLADAFNKGLACKLYERNGTDTTIIRRFGA